MNTRIKFRFLLLLSVFLFSACTIERKLALEFIKQKKSSVAVFVVPPYSLNLFNNNEYNLDSVYIPKDYPIDSLLFNQTYLLKDISDSIFLENYLNGFINSLRKSGFQVFLPDALNAFQEIESKAYIFRFAQVDLSEEIYPYEINEDIGGEEFSKVFPLNLVTANSWFEFEARDTAWRKVFYAEDALVDEFSAELKLDDSGKNTVLYYVMDSLSVADVYQMATDVGMKYAGYLTDYLMNTYIKQQFPPNLSPSIIFHYDPEYKMLFPYEEGFQEITKEK